MRSEDKDIVKISPKNYTLSNGVDYCCVGLKSNEESNEKGKFNHAHGIDVDSKGYVYVNELENPRIQKFLENGTFVKQCKTMGV